MLFEEMKIYLPIELAGKKTNKILLAHALNDTYIHNGVNAINNKEKRFNK